MVKQILVVCNNETMKDYLSGILQKHFNPVFKSSSQEALLWLRMENLPDLILMDVEDNQSDYLEFVSKLRKRAVNDLPLILLSELKNYRAVLHCLQFGATDFITKPFFPEELLDKINQILKPQAYPFRKMRHLPKLRPLSSPYLS